MQTHPEPSHKPPPPTHPEDGELFSLRITLHTIELLDAVARHGSVAAAANTLSMPPSSLSTALQTLEARLGLTLFYPDSAPAQPTPACKALLDEGRLLLQARTTDCNPARQPPGL
ncbi:LysR family transcriptional regulator [Zoogloea sp.]|uniref:LysR family transcriptional regulator n=1 Tax=Zoogloea sp. TaxID=49181 RepID=UPI0031FDC8C9